MLKDFIGKKTAFNKSVEEKLGKIDILASKVDSLVMLLVDVGAWQSLCVVNDQPVGNPKRKV
jgi:hypothetical protein